MARNRFRGDAAAVAQISKFTVTAAGAAGDIVTLTCNRKTVAYTMATGNTAADIAAGIVAAASVAGVPAEIAEALWTSVGADVFGTAATAGKPFTVTVAASGTTTVGAVSTTTASAGPNHWDTATNWTLNAVPVNTNDVDITGTDVSILWGLDQSAVALASLNIDSTFTGKIGNPEWNGTYYEYRDTYLRIGATTVNIGSGQGGCSSLIKLDFGATTPSVTVYGSAGGAQQGTPAVFLKSSGALTKTIILGGAVGLAFNPGETCVCGDVQLGGAATGSGPDVTLGAGFTPTNLVLTGGKCLQLPAAGTIAYTSITTKGGELTLKGTVNITTLNGRSGVINYDANGTIGTTVINRAVLDHSREPQASKIMTNTTVNAGATLLDPNKSVTFSNPILLNCRYKDVTLELGEQISVQRT